MDYTTTEGTYLGIHPTTEGTYLGIHPTLDGWHMIEVSTNNGTVFVPLHVSQFEILLERSR